MCLSISYMSWAKLFLLIVGREQTNVAAPQGTQNWSLKCFCGIIIETKKSTQSDKTHRWKYLHIQSFQGSLCERVIAWGCLDHGSCSCVMLSGFWGMGSCNAVTGHWDLTKGAVYWPWLGIRKLSFIYISIPFRRFQQAASMIIHLICLAVVVD